MMSTNYLLRNGMIAALGITGLTLSACAGGQGSRYTSVYDYESGGNGNCGASPCATAPAYASYDFEDGSRYGSSEHTIYNYEGVPGNCGNYESPCAPTPQPTPTPPPVYGGCGPAPAVTCGISPAAIPAAPIYGSAAPVSSYSGSSYSGTISSSSSAVECPAGTTLQPDNTCLQGGGSTYSSGSSYSSTTTTSYPSTTSYSSSYSSGGAVDCPAGTTRQPDNSCLQGGGSSYVSSGSSHISSGISSYDSGASTSYSSGTSYGGGSSISSHSSSCPSGTVMQGDGSCMSMGYSSGSYTESDYLPIRK